MDDEFLVKEFLSPQDRAILMCIERIDKLEAQVDRFRITLLNTIAACASIKDIALDVFFFLSGIKPEERLRCNAKVIKDVLPKYMSEAATNPRIQQMCKIVVSPKSFLHLSHEDVESYTIDTCTCYYFVSDDVKGTNLYTFLSTWTLKELEEYWEYRLKWSKWVL